MAGYTPRQFTCLQAVTHPSSNRAQCRLTTLIKANALTTTLLRHPYMHWTNGLSDCRAIKLMDYHANEQRLGLGLQLGLGLGLGLVVH